MKLYNDVYFNRSIGRDDFRVEFWKELTRYIQNKYFPPSKLVLGFPVTLDVLDLGCGNCLFINNVKHSLRSGIDISPQAKKLFEGLYLQIKNVTKANYFPMDVVFSSNLFEHLTKKEIRLVLNKIKLKPQGRLILLLPNFKYCYKEFYDEATHVTPLTFNSMKELLEDSGFKIVASEERFLPYSVNSNDFVKLIPKSWVQLVSSLYFDSWFRFPGQMLIVAEKQVKGFK